VAITLDKDTNLTGNFRWKNSLKGIYAAVLYRMRICVLQTLRKHG